MLRISQYSSVSSQQSEQQYVPLKHVSVETFIKFFAADVTIKQVFRNDETKPIEAVYCFPIEEQAAIYSFIARIDDRELIAQLKEKNETQREYSDALEQGHGAYLLEQDEKSQDNFIINVGALPAGKECHISISYVSELDLVENGSRIRFVVPTTIAPRYNPNTGDVSSPAGTTSKYVQTAPYTIEFRCQLEPLKWLEKHPPRKGRVRQIFLLTDGEISNVNEVLDLCRSMATSTRIFSFGLGHSPSRSLVKGLARATNGCFVFIPPFLLTDGEISNVNEVLDLCRSMATSTRIFSFGLGHSPSRSLVKGLARATNGRFVFIPPNTSVDIHVGEQLQKALQSCITNIQVKWNLGANVMSAPTKIPPVYANDRLIVYALANNPTFVFGHNSSVELCNDRSRLGDAKIDCIPNVSMNGTIARLAAKALILELQHSKLPSSAMKKNSGSLQSRFQEDPPSPIPATTIDEKEVTKKSIIELSLKYQILSPHTAFIGVEKRVNGSNVDMVLREVPIQISKDDQHLQTPRFMRFSANRMPTSGMSFHGMPVQTKMRSSTAGSVRNYEMDYCASASIPQVNSFSEQVDEDFECLDRNVVHSTSSSSTSSGIGSSITSHLSDLFHKGEDKTWPTGDQNIVRYLINKQKFDGLWDLDAKDIEHLTGKPLASFPSSNNKQVLISAIVIIAFETRFVALSAMWHGVVQKARKRLLHLFSQDTKQFESLLASVRQQF
ncbi:unnamed protein product [Rotaria sp. Silwood1]|nr:unnamed protein product [Rotaria sp. Silwood1]